MSEKALQTATKRREAKGKREKERYTLPNAKFQRTARRDKNALLSDHCEEIEEDNKMGKTREHSKKGRDTKETSHTKMGKIKDRWYGPKGSRRYKEVAKIHRRTIQKRSS